jgi:hypothetical protein
MVTPFLGVVQWSKLGLGCLTVQVLDHTQLDTDIHTHTHTHTP